MKPYGLRPGDGDKSNRYLEDQKYGSKRRNKFTERRSYEHPRGKHREAKLHDERKYAHSQARSDQKKDIREEVFTYYYFCTCDENCFFERYEVGLQNTGCRCQKCHPQRRPEKPKNV